MWMHPTVGGSRFSLGYRLGVTATLLMFALLASHGAAQVIAPRPRAMKPDHTIITADQFVDRLTVKFHDGLHVRLRQGELTDEGTGALADLAARNAIETASRGEWSRSFPLDENRLDQMRATAEASLGRAIADLNLQFDLILPADVDASQVIDMLNALDCVELAQPMPRPSPLPVPPNFQPSQVYLNASPPGVNALNAWSVSGVTGAGIKIADIEYSWNFSHQDLPAVTHLGPAGIDPFNDKNHGTAVLGEVGSLNNGWGTTGISYSSQLYVAAANTAGGYNVGGAILTAAAALSPGDVIIIEQQISGPAGGGNYVPVEWFAPWYNAIATVVGNGIVVVEAAGNGNQNLDGPSFSMGNGGHWPFLPQNDSGAIIVGAGAAPTPLGSTVDRSRLTFSTYGSTVDLQGWGERVMTLGYGDAYSAEGVNLWYTAFFSGTSSASPIVAGACALVQSKHKAQFGTVLTPLQLRDLLRSTGSPQQAGINPISQNIGPRPNVTAAIAGFIRPPPINDNCPFATALPAGSHAFTTVDATTDGPDESGGCGMGQIHNEVWYRFGASCAPGTVTVSLCGASYDSRLAIYTQPCPAGPSALVCNDNFCGDDAQVSLHVDVTQNLRIRVGGATAGATGTGTLVITCTPDAICASDVNHDSVVNLADLLEVISLWGSNDPDADINDDNVVNLADLLLVVGAWGACG